MLMKANMTLQLQPCIFFFFAFPSNEFVFKIFLNNLFSFPPIGVLKHKRGRKKYAKERFPFYFHFNLKHENEKFS